jgi:hypothetical protein
MARGDLTELQRQALQQVERAKTAGVSVSAQCRADGLSVRQVYDALIALRRRGVISALSPRARRSPSAFVAVEVATLPSTRPTGSLAPTPTLTLAARTVCRVMLPGSVAIECSEWPPGAWLASLAVESAGR